MHFCIDNNQIQLGMSPHLSFFELNSIESIEFVEDYY